MTPMASATASLTPASGAVVPSSGGPDGLMLSATIIPTASQCVG